jgi:hypothetical protein
VQPTLLDVDPDDLDDAALARGTELLARVVSRLDDVRVIVAGDFEQAVRDRVDDPDYAAAYTAERLFGRAAAKTIRHDDGSTDLSSTPGCLASAIRRAMMSSACSITRRCTSPLISAVNR